jgi:hypothetical protein
MVSTIITIVTALLGALAGYVANTQTEKRKKYLATKREQLQFVYAPLEVLTRINKQEFDRYFAENTTEADKEYIERHVWYPNNREIKKIIMTNAHLLEDMPEAIYDLIAHINVWISEYNLVHISNVKKGPVFVAYKGHRYPREVDAIIREKANQLRKILNK